MSTAAPFLNESVQNPDVIIVGAGPAGIAAALRLARAGRRVLVFEGADYSGAENWSGCVYHAEPLLREDVLGAALLQEAPRERRIVTRKLVFHDGACGLGLEARACEANDYGEAWTVLRPRFDRWLAARAIDFGAILLPRTTVTGLLYDQGRVIGVRTERGPVAAPVVFLAEGDAAGLLRREGLERATAPHYAQGVKAVLSLPARDIETRFGLSGNTGLAAEWVLRNVSSGAGAGRLNITAFLYTNRDTLSLGFVVPLERLARNGPRDHAALLRRLLGHPAIAPLIHGAELVGYGAKVIRAGGWNERPEWTRDGIAVGGSALGLGLEMPYPQFIGPALASGVLFGDAVLAAGSDGAASVREYERRLRESPETANARWLSRWPSALHESRAFFDRLPALCGHVAASLDAGPARDGWRARALAQAIMDPGAWAGAWPFMRALRGRAGRAGPLSVRFFTVSRGIERPLALPAALARAVGEVYGRRERFIEHRLGNARGHLWRLLPGSFIAAGKIVVWGVAGAFLLLQDALSYRRYRGALAPWLARHPYHRYEQEQRRAPAPIAGADAVALIAHTDRPRPDRRHISLPCTLDAASMHALAHVCPAAVYLGGGTLPAVHYENCIKCESCRVIVPTIDWNRTSTHRLRYRLPDTRRYGFDGAAHAQIAPGRVPEPPAIDPDRRLARSLAARPAHVSPAWIASWRARIDATADKALRVRLRADLDQGHYGWIERELAPPPRIPAPPGIMRTRDHAFRARFEHRLTELASGGWSEADCAAFLEYLDTLGGREAVIIEWLARWSPALAWVALLHILAAARLRTRPQQLAAAVFAAGDGGGSWVPEAASLLVAADGAVQFTTDLAVTDRAHALDAARPVRRGVAALPSGEPAPLLAALTAAFAQGFTATLRQRAFDYARTRVQFPGAFKDRQGRDAIAKFGAVKELLARLAAGSELLQLARPVASDAPAEVLNLVAVTLAPSPTGVPWTAGQIFGGMAYSEEDLLAPRYRDAMLLAHWPGFATPDEARAERFATVLAARFEASERLQAYIAARPLTRASRVRYVPARATGRPRARPWEPRLVRHRSGDFLRGMRLAPGDVLTPEHFRRDPRLRATRAEVLRLLRGGFRSPVPGQDYGRYIDARHALTEEDVLRLRSFNAFATIVPESLGGKGWRKSQYAVLTRLLMGRIDTAAGLLVMASTSIGTTPVLLGLDKDLPRMARALAAFQNEHVTALAQRIHEVQAALAPPRPRLLKRRLTRAIEESKRLLLAPGNPLRYLARDYLEALFAAGQCGRNRDLAGLEEGLRRAGAALDVLPQELDAERARLAPRAAAHERFLAALGAGEISAFALTEPSAGSDTGALQTHALRKRAALMALRPGFYRFEAEDRGERVLIDATRVQVQGRRLGYVLPDETWAPIIQGARGAPRHVVVGGEPIVFHDIGRVVSEDGAAWYRYWEVTGAKMWITNGSIADRFCVYARTPSGETGFMVDARSEGVTAGRDERKLGQRASATNELRFDRVRVDDDQVIGFVGHGQANALETLSVGRGGIVTGCATLLKRLVFEYGNRVAGAPEAVALAHAEWQRVETLAARLVGLTDTVAQDGDFRVEAAFSKYLASEGLHRVLLLIERGVGPGAASASSPLEKWRRDARVLNIYEGTNEVQRFLILKDLPRLLKDVPQALAGGDALTAARARFLDVVRAPLATLGDAVWQDPDQQVRWFPVVDWLGELYVWSALEERCAVIRAWGDPADAALHRELAVALDYTRERAETFARDVAEAFRIVASGAPDAQEQTLAMANAALDAEDTERSQTVLLDGAPCGSWVALVRARLRFAPDGPRFDGWCDSDLAALDCVLEWADTAPLRIAVLLMGPPGLEDEVRRFEAAGAEVLYLEDSCASAGHEQAHLIREHWPEARRFVCGSEGSSFSVALAAALDAQLVTGPRVLRSTHRGEWIIDPPAGPRARARAVVLAFASKPTGRCDQFSVAQWLKALRGPIRHVSRTPVWTAVDPVPAPPPGDTPQRFARPEELAQWLKRRFNTQAAEPEATLVAQRAACTIGAV